MRAEIVARPRDADEVDPRIVRRDALEHHERPKLVAVALDDERQARRRGERRLVAWPRPLPWRDRMAKDHERLRRLLLGVERGNRAPGRASSKGDAVVALDAERV